MFASRAWVSDEGEAMALRLSDQTKTSRGRIPVRGARIEAGGAHDSSSFIVFDLVPAHELAGRAQDADAASRFSLEGLSSTRADGVVDRRDVLATARFTGPLFGGESRERVTDWLCAMAVAREAVSIQEVLNKTKPLVPALMPVEKRVARNARTGTCFRIFSIAFDLGPDGESAYERMMPQLPFLRKFRSATFDYAFAAREVEDGGATLLLFLLSFEDEIPMSDFAAAVRYFVGEEVVGQALQALAGYEGGFAKGSGGPGSLDLLSETGNLLVSDERIVEEDFPCVQRLMYALVSLHLEGARVDVFATEGDGDFMTFDSYLCCLWYEFAKKLGKVRIGYCAQCGKSFSLTGHRGVERRFCSERCKTKAKNDRTGALRDEVRERFYAGESVDRLALEVFPKDSPPRAVERVVAHLKGWKRLQHDIDAALVLKGSREKLLARCLAEGVTSEVEIAERARYLADNPRVVREVRRREGV